MKIFFQGGHKPELTFHKSWIWISRTEMTLKHKWNFLGQFLEGQLSLVNCLIFHHHLEVCVPYAFIFQAVGHLKVNVVFHEKDISTDYHYLMFISNK